MIWLLLFYVQSARASRPVLHYEPVFFDLAGVLDLQTFPGPPNYESIASGDEVERHFYLKLDLAIDVSGIGADVSIDNPGYERNVKVEIHIFLGF